MSFLETKKLLFEDMDTIALITPFKFDNDMLCNC